MRKKRLLILIALIPLVLFGLILTGGSVFLRAVPYVIPEEVRYHSPAGEAALTLRYEGIAGYELTDGKTVVLIDPTVTRPTLIGLFLGRFSPDAALAAERFPRADFIVVKHAHYDHVADVPGIALRTGATVVGTPSTVNLALSRGVPRDKTIVVRPGQRLTLGTFTVDVAEFEHSPILGVENVMVGTIPEDAGRLWWWQYVQDGAYGYRFSTAKASIWFTGPSIFESEGVLPADTLVIGIAGHRYDAERMRGILSRAKPKRIIPSHYDNFFQPLTRGLTRLPVVDMEWMRRIIKEAAPDLPYYILDHGQSITLPSDAS